MKPHVLIAIDQFTDHHIERISDALSGWATWERISRNSPDEIYAHKLKSAQIAVGYIKPEHIVNSSVQMLQSGSVGYDPFLDNKFDFPAEFNLCNASGVMSVAVAEHCIAMMMALVRRIPRHIRLMGRCRWERQPEYGELDGSTACIIGLGDIGTEIARRCVGLNMNVIGVRKNAGVKHSVIEQVYPPEKLAEAVALADHIVLILPATAATKQLLNAEMLDVMKQGVYLYNLARGGLLDEAELIKRLETGQVAGAGLDVFSEEPLAESSLLWELDNVIITPHCAGRSSKEFDRLCNLFVRNLDNFRNGKSLINRIALSWNGH